MSRKSLNLNTKTLSFFLYLLVFLCVNHRKFKSNRTYCPIIDNEEILYSFCKLLIVLKFTYRVMFTVFCEKVKLSRKGYVI